MKSWSALLVLAFFLGASKSWALGARPPRFDSGTPQGVVDLLKSDLAAMDALRGDGQETPLHQEIFGGPFDGPLYTKFFESHVARLGYEDEPDALAYTTNFPFFRGHTWVTDDYTNTSKTPQIARMGALLHEARHTETLHGGWPHVQCLPKEKIDSQGHVYGVPFYYGKMDACDATAYGAHGTFLAFVSDVIRDCTNCNEKTKFDAQIWFDTYLQFVIDDSAHERILRELKSE